MKKKLVAVAVAGVLAAPLAAQAQTANVTLYGRLNLDVEVVNGKPTGQENNPAVTRVSSNSSRLGVRGTESLGGGLSAVFQIESGVPADTGNGNLGSRDTFVGLQGAWGTVKLGRFNAPYDDIQPIFGSVPTLNTSILATSALWSQGWLSKTQGGFDDRLSNSIRYDSPTISGFTGSAQISLAESNPAQAYPGNVHAYVLGLGGFYNNGPLQIGVAYELNNRVRGPDQNDWALAVAGGYNFGLFRLGLVYQRLDYEQPGNLGHLTQNMYGVSGIIPVGPGTLFAYWGGASGGGSCSATGTNACRVGGLTNGSGDNAQQYSITYTYPLSKRTLLYAGYVGVNNDDNASYTFGVNPYNVSSQGFGMIGSNQNGFALGTVHFF